MTSRHKHFRRVGHAALGCGIALLTGMSAYGADPSARDATDLAIVDCLLPPTVQKLGGRLTYLTPRRPAKLVARDCEIKGGEYTAFDRANYEDALKVWLEAAESGDAEAQTAVGEIYEKGLGRAPDYAQAAVWYSLAAEQGETRAMLGLAYLHEQGLGVEADPLKAVNYYRQATGIVDDNLVFESDLVAAQAEAQRVVDALTARLEKQNEEVESLQSRLALTQQRLDQRRSALRSATAQADELRSQVEQIQAGGVTDAERARFEAERAQLKTQEDQLARRAREVAELEETLAKQRGKLYEEFRQASAQDTKLEDRLYAQDQEIISLRDDLSTARNELFEKDKRLSVLESSLAAERLRLASTKEESAQQQDELTHEQQQEIALRERRIAEQVVEIKQLREQQNESLKMITELREREEELAARSESHRAEIEQSRAELAKTKQRSLETEQRLMDLTAQLEKEREDIAQEREQLLIREQQATSSQQREINALRAELERRESLLSGQETLISNLRDQRQQLEDKVNELQTRPAPITVATRSIERGPRPEERIPPTQGIAKQFGLGEFHALIIGNNNYQYLEDLKTPVNDAAAIEDVLKHRYGFKTRVLHDATNSQIMTALNEYKGKLRENDSLLIYYAGHGELDEGTDRANWLPVDAEPDNTAKWIPDQQISMYVGMMKAKHVLVIADSCYSGSMTRNSAYRVKRKNASGSVDLNLLKALAGMKSRTVMTSGGEKPVIDGVGGPNSIFAEQLIYILKTNDRVMDDESLYGDLFDGVRESAAQVNKEQMPQYSQIHDAGHGQGLFLFIPTSG